MFKGLGALGDIGKVMRQAQEMQQKMAELQQRLDHIEVEGRSGAGLVTAVCTAKGALRRVTVDQSLLAGGEEKAVLEDLIVAAVNDAQVKAQEKAAAAMQELTAGLGLPPGFMPPV